MLRPLSSLFSPNSRQVTDEDVRRYIEVSVRQAIGNVDVFCVSLVDNVAIVRVSSAADVAEVSLREHDLLRDIKREMGYTLKRVKARLS